MIRKLKKEFIFTAMIGVSIVLIALLGTLNAINIHTIYGEIKETLLLLSESVDKKFSDFEDIEEDFSFTDFLEDPKNRQDMILSSNFFVVRMDADGKPIYVNTKQITSLTENEATHLAVKVQAHKTPLGTYGRYRFHITNIGGIKTIVFLDISEEIVSFLRILLLSLGLGIVCWGLMLILAIKLSNKAISPVAASIETQKQFITNASHELKTPVSVILSNVEALELYTSQTKWSNNIKNQSLHLTKMVQDLSTLSKMDEKALTVNTEDIPVSDLLQTELNAYQTRINSKNITLYCDLDDNIWGVADRDQLEKLFAILIDNAITYANKNGTIWVRLNERKQHFVFEIENTCDVLPDVPPEKLFERFYRADKTRHYGEGKCGIGLSIAKAIVDSHNGKIDSNYLPENRICFTVYL